MNTKTLPKTNKFGIYRSLRKESRVCHVRLQEGEVVCVAKDKVKQGQ